MLIRNIIPNKRTFVCGRFLGEWLHRKMGLPLLAIDSKAYYFADTESLQEVLENAPPYIKFILWLEKK